MRSVVIYFAPPDAKQIGLLNLLLERHGIEVEVRSSETHPEDFLPTRPTDLLLLAVSARARLDRQLPRHVEAVLAAGDLARAIRIDETMPATLDSRLSSLRSYDYSSDGVTALFADLEAAFLPMSRVRNFEPKKTGSERRTWNLQRYRYGLWLAFSRSTGAGKFDPYPLTLSKQLKTIEALEKEVAGYRYVDPVTESPMPSKRVLTEAIESVWHNTDEIAPNAIHVIEATAEEIWNRYSPSMASRQRTA